MSESPWQKSKEYLAYQWYVALGGSAGVAGEATWQKSLNYWLWQIAVLYGDTATNWHMPIEYWLYRIYVLNGGTATNWYKSAEYWARLIYNQLTASASTANFSLEYWLYYIANNLPPSTSWYNVAGFTPIAAYQPKGAASLAASYINLVNPGTHDAIPTVAPTWNTLTGWTFNGTTQHLSTDIVPGSGWTLIAQFAGATVTGNRILAGVDSAPDSRLVIGVCFDALSPNNVIYCSGGFEVVVPSLVAGNLCVAGQQGYRNGAAEGGAISAWTAPNTNVFMIGCWNMSGVPSFFYQGEMIGLAIYNTVFVAGDVLLTATDMALI